MTTTIKIQTVNVRIPKELVEWLDSLISKGLYKSRSEIIRDYIRKFIQERGNRNG